MKSPRWEHFGTVVQMEDHIQNAVPTWVSDKELQSKRAPETYTSMLHNQTFRGNVTIKATMSFDYCMAPLIVIAPKLGQDTSGRAEYREHFEIVLFNKGVNVWHHVYKDGKPSWKKAAYARFSLEPKTPYTLEVRKKGKQLDISVAGHVFGYLDDSLPDEFRVGLTGCEGINRFYSFEVSN